MSVIYLIRHGRTEANEKHLYCGSTDLPLSEAGRSELEGLRAAYTVPPGCRFVTSGMRRTAETLEILFGAVPCDEEPDLREVDFGAFEMRNYEELRSDPAYQVWLEGDNMVNVPPGGESGDRMRARALAAFRRIRDAARDTVVVTHGGVIAAIMAALFPGEGKNRYEWQPAPGRGYRLDPEGYAPIP